MEQSRLSPFGSPTSAPFRRMAALFDAINRITHDVPPPRLLQAVEQLSLGLSRSRGSLVRQDYLESPMSQAAYCVHFLPWNVYRLCLAWQNSPMRSIGPECALHDWGAGPMTGLIALWVQTGLEGPNALASYTAVERQHEILGLGEDIVQRLGIDKLVDIHAHPRTLDFEEEPSQEKADILLVSQSFNEWLPPRGRNTDSIRAFVKHARAHVNAGGELFLMEPASRIVSWGVMELRNMLTESATILAPCTHTASCPLLDPRLKSWCHFRRRIAPHPLHGKLRGALPPEREAVSYSYLHARFTPSEHAKEQRFALARVISEPFALEDGRGVYGCSAQGRILIATRSKRWAQPLVEALAPDSLVSYPRQGKHPRDKKSRALKIWLSDCRKPDGSRYGAPVPAKKDDPS